MVTQAISKSVITEQMGKDLAALQDHSMFRSCERSFYIGQYIGLPAFK